MFSVYEDIIQLKPEDIDRIGSLHARQVAWEYNSLDNNYTWINNELKFHTCTSDEISKFGTTV